MTFPESSFDLAHKIEAAAALHPPLSLRWFISVAEFVGKKVYSYLLISCLEIILDEQWVQYSKQREVRKKS